ncbi:hypothetical protein N9940_00720 [bacterium]|nr:hypothetical protein [bacterium]MDB4296098.1 hypothetical protein [bacterium]MDB4352552.1 hypothetical protein [Porticoccaceae bacterium]
MHPTYLGWQVDWPVFIKRPLMADSKTWKQGDYFNWFERGIDADKVATLYVSGYIHHNKELEVQTKVGDRLSELAGKQLDTLVNLLNAEVKKRTSSTSEFETKKCKKSKLDDKQRGLIRRFLNSNSWVIEDFYNIRDKILND